MFKLSLDPSDTSWKKVPESVKKLYWDEFKVYTNFTFITFNQIKWS